MKISIEFYQYIAAVIQSCTDSSAHSSSKPGIDFMSYYSISASGECEPPGRVLGSIIDNYYGKMQAPLGKHPRKRSYAADCLFNGAHLIECRNYNSNIS